MATCFLCGAASVGPTCHACLKAGRGAPPKRKLTDLLGRGGRRRGAAEEPRTETTEVELPVLAPTSEGGDDRTGFEADTAEVLANARPEPGTDEIPLVVVSVPTPAPCAAGHHETLDDAFAALEATPPEDAVPVLSERDRDRFPQCEATTESVVTPPEVFANRPAEVTPTHVEQVSQGVVVESVPPRALDEAAAAPPADGTGEAGEPLERWNAILDESPVFAGQGRFDVLKPGPRAPGTLDVAIGARFDVASAPAESESVVHLLVTVTPNGAPLTAGRGGPVAHVVLALDLSASMDAPDKYPVLKRALWSMMRDLKASQDGEVLLSVVVFAYGSETLLRAVPSSHLDPGAVMDALDAWDRRFTRYTDLVGALHRAGRIARDQVAADRAMPVRIYVLTDGRPQDMAGAREVTSRIARLPVDVCGLAFGDDADVGSLTELFSGGRGGTVKHVRGDTIGEAFGRIGDVARLVVANRALLDVELRGGVIGGEAYRYRPARHRYPQGAFQKGTRFSADLGTLESGRTYALLFQLRLRRAKGGAAESEVGRIALRVPGFGGPRTFEGLLSIPRHPGVDAGERDPDVQEAVDVLSAEGGGDPRTTLKALRIRREIYARERRDPHVLAVIDKAISELERCGNLASLTPSERATLVAHTLTTRVGPQDVEALRQRAAALHEAGTARAVEVLADAETSDA